MYIFPGQIIECVVSIALCYPLARGFQNKPVSLYGAVSAIVISNEGNFFILIVWITLAGYFTIAKTNNEKK